MSVDIPFSEKLNVANRILSRKQYNTHSSDTNRTVSGTAGTGSTFPTTTQCYCTTCPSHKSNDSHSLIAQPPIDNVFHSHHNKHVVNSDINNHPWSCFINNRMDAAFERKIKNNWSPSHSPKIHKNTLNTLTKQMTIAHPYPHPLSIFHIHTLHLHLFLSLTLILVTHKCPHYLIVL